MSACSISVVVVVICRECNFLNCSHLCTCMFYTFTYYLYEVYYSRVYRQHTWCSRQFWCCFRLWESVRPTSMNLRWMWACECIKTLVKYTCTSLFHIHVATCSSALEDYVPFQCTDSISSRLVVLDDMMLTLHQSQMMWWRR